MLKELLSDETKLRFKARSENSRDRALLQRAYEDYIGKWTPTTCRNCVLDRYIELYVSLKNKELIMQDTKFKLSAGVLLSLGFSTGEFITSVSCTDEKAIRALRRNPADIKFFTGYPANWEELIADPKPEATEATEATEANTDELPAEQANKLTTDEAIEYIADLRTLGVTREQVYADILASYTHIDEKPISKNIIKTLFAKAGKE